MLPATLLAGLLSQVTAAQILEVPPPPGNLSTVEHLTQSDDYVVEVKKSSEATYTPCFVYKTDNYAPKWLKFQDSASFTDFAFSGTPVDVRITCQFAASSVVVRPLDFGVVPVRVGNVITFTLSEPRKLSIEVNDRRKPLFLFAQAPDVPDPGATYYYAPGTVTNIGLQKQLKSGERVYIAAGAVVEGSFKFDWNSSNIRVGGRGILCMGEWPWESNELTFLGSHSMFSGATNHLQMEGLHLVNSTGWQIPIYNSGGYTVHDNQLCNLKLISWNPNSDGIWVNGNNIVVDDCFIFNNDDVTMSHAVSNSTISNLVVWGGPSGRVYMHSQEDLKPLSENLVMENIQIIGKDSGKELILMEGGASYTQTIRNMTFRNIQVEAHPQGAGFWATNKLIILNTTGTTSISGLLFDNIRLNGKNTDEGDLYGTPSSPIDGITFRNLSMAGTSVMSLADANMDKNDFATRIVFEQAPEIGIRSGSSVIPDGSGAADFEEVATISTRTITYTVSNSGWSALHLGGTPRVTVAGAGFALAADAAGTIGPSGTTTFQVRFTPSAAAAYTGLVSVTSDDDDESPYTFSLTGVGTVAAVVAPVIGLPLSATGTVRTPLTYQITALNTPTSYNATGLPAGMTINASTGAISGTPTAAGSFSVVLSATNGGGTGTATLLLTVAAASDITPPATPSAPTTSSPTSATPTLSGTTEAAATIRIYDGSALTATVTADGSGAWSYTVSPALGAGTHQITVTATDAAGNTSARSGQTIVSVAPTVPGGGEAGTASDGSGSGGCGMGSAMALLTATVACFGRLRVERWRR